MIAFMYGACVIAFMYGTCVIALMYRACVRTWGRGTSRVSFLRYACTRTCLRAYITRSRQAHIRNALWYRAAHGRGPANTRHHLCVFEQPHNTSMLCYRNIPRIESHQFPRLQTVKAKTLTNASKYERWFVSHRLL